MSLISRKITVSPWQVALERYQGRPTVVLGAGRHRRPWGADHEYVDLRRQQGALAVQEIPSADGLTIKVSVVHTWHVVDAAAFAERSADPCAEVYLATQVALREALTGLSAEEVVALPRIGLGARVRAAVTAVAAEVGVAVDEVVVKDVILPAEVRSAAAEVVVGRHRAQAQLEAARAQTAALRSLANGAKLLDDHPALARVRLVEALPFGAEVKVVIGDATD
jgi:regulator of protease activity HflC (stomatin/prohibitin superfamily)